MKCPHCGAQIENAIQGVTLRAYGMVDDQGNPPPAGIMGDMIPVWKFGRWWVCWADLNEREQMEQEFTILDIKPNSANGKFWQIPPNENLFYWRAIPQDWVQVLEIDYADRSYYRVTASTLGAAPKTIHIFIHRVRQLDTRFRRSLPHENSRPE